LVVLKIIKHSEHERQTGAGDVAQGYLTGLIAAEDRRLEVTNSFPMPKVRADDDEEALARHQEQMLRMFRHINVDYLLVGWYQSAPFGASFNETAVESMFEYQTQIEDSVVLIYDPVKTNQGLLNIRAYRLSADAMRLCYKDFSPESIKKAKISYENLFEELPVTIKNSHLVNISMCEMALAQKPGPTKHFLDLGSSGTLEKCMRQTMGHVDHLKDEVNKYIKYSANKQRYETLKENYIQKRHLENEHRRSRNEPLLPLEDESAKMPRPPQAPTMLDGLLHAADINAHVDHTLQVAAQNLSKLFIAECIIGEKAGAGKERTMSTISGQQ